jgi:hypothetical protein
MQLCRESALHNIRRVRLVGPFESNSQHMQHLSEKAKGKQRADPIPVDVFNNGDPIPPRQLMVRFTEGVQDLVIQVADDDSVRDVKAKVCPCSSLLSAPSYAAACISILIYTVRSEKRALNSSAVACASSTPDGSSPT